MKQNITDDACIVDFCALKNITMQVSLSFFPPVWIPPQIWFLQNNVAFMLADETAISNDQSADGMNKEQINTRR